MKLEKARTSHLQDVSKLIFEKMAVGLKNYGMIDIIRDNVSVERHELS